MGSPGSLEALREIDTIEIKNSFKKIQQRHQEISGLQKVLTSCQSTTSHKLFEVASE